MSTVKVGDDFRDLVADLLRTQFTDVKVEQILGGSKVDITFTKEDFGKSIRYAVECKNYEDALTKSYISSNIYPIYKPLVDANIIDRVLIISRRPLGAQASGYVDMWASHQTYSQLAESLIGFRGYVQGLAQLRPTEDTPYVEARIEGRSHDALNDVEAWIAETNSPAVAILGGYGQGKTSFAKRVAAEFAARYLADPTGRLPILLRLGEVVHETQLEGLFGKEFTARHHVRGYNFQALDLLNRQGRLLILLDGFDEMKHAMTAADFQANFQEFNRLLVPNAKVVLLGRPNALPSDERELVFRGKKQIGEQTVASSTFSAWTEWRLAFFDENETLRLLEANLSLLIKRYSADGTYQYVGDFLAGRVAEIVKKVPSDLLRRPVHVALIAEVGADPAFDLDGFNEYRLYSHFIRSMVERDTRDKPARRVIPLAHRLQFQRELAWWAWHRVGATQGCFFRRDVPDQLFSELPDGNSVDPEGKRNEYIVSTLTEEKESGVLFFAHRSFQEYLVAEHIRIYPSTPAAHVDYSAFLTSDVVAFLAQVPEDESDYILGWYETLRACAGPINIAYLRFFASQIPLLKHLSTSLAEMKRAELDVWTILIAGIAAHHQAEHGPTWDKLEALCLELIRSAKTIAAAAATLVLLGRIERQPVLAAKISGALLNRCLQARHSDNSDRSALTIDSERVDFSTTWLGEMVRRDFSAPGQTTPMTLNFDKKALSTNILSMLASKNILVKESLHIDPFSASADPAMVTVNAMQAFNFIDKGLREAHSQFLNARVSSFKVVPVKVVAQRRFQAAEPKIARLGAGGK